MSRVSLISPPPGFARSFSIPSRGSVAAAFNSMYTTGAPPPSMLDIEARLGIDGFGPESTLPPSQIKGGLVDDIDSATRFVNATGNLVKTVEQSFFHKFCVVVSLVFFAMIILLVSIVCYCSRFMRAKLEG